MDHFSTWILDHDLFSDTVTRLGYVVSNGIVITEGLGKDMEGNYHGQVCGSVVSFAWIH